MYEEQPAIYIFRGYKGEKITNKLRRIVRNIQHRRVINKLGLIPLIHNCKECNSIVNVYSSRDRVIHQWGKQNPVGLCEKCIREGKEPNNSPLPDGIL